MIDFYMYSIDSVLNADAGAFFVVLYGLVSLILVFVWSTDMDAVLFKFMGDKPYTRVFCAFLLFLMTPFAHLMIMIIVLYTIIYLQKEARKEWGL